MNEINLSPFKFKKVWRPVLRFFSSYFVLLLIGVIFCIFLGFSFNPFSNKQIIAVLSGKGDGKILFSSRCVTLQNTSDKSLLSDLNLMMQDQAFFYKNKVAPIFFVNLPQSMVTLQNKEDIDLKKQLFIKMILPLVILSNMHSEEDRNTITYLSNKMPKAQLNDQDIGQLKELAAKYNVDSTFATFWDDLKVLNQLQVKVNTIPNSLVLAIAIKESGWGQSRFVQNGNALFSVHTWQPNQGIIPLQSNPGDRETVRKYANLQASVDSFFNNINSSDHYERFRAERIKLNGTKNGVNVLKLANVFGKYSEEGQGYLTSLQEIIKSNNLTKYDKYNTFIERKPLCVHFN